MTNSSTFGQVKSPLITLDDCARAFTFPVFDNGYFYLAASRLSVFCRDDDWAIVIETFGSNPRAGGPGLVVQTYGDNLYNRNLESDYVTLEAHADYLRNNPHNEFRSFYPVEDDAWVDTSDDEMVMAGASHAKVRGQAIEVPTVGQLVKAGIAPERDGIAVFEASRFWAREHRDLVLGTTEERTVNVQPGMRMILELDEWQHPDISGGQLPSDTDCFRGICDAALSNDPARYSSTATPNTHWRNWPEGGAL